MGYHNLFFGDYPVYSYNDLHEDNCSELSHAVKHRNLIICTTPTVHREYGDRILSILEKSSANHVHWKIMDIDERTKNIESMLDICREAQKIDLGRSDALVALGGGVCSDVTRVASSLIRRGIGHICIPTTLVGMMDAAIGIEGGLNFEQKKSYLGTFHAPESVFLFTTFLHSLPHRQLRDGMSECIKLAICYDENFFSFIERHGRDLVLSRFTSPLQEGEKLVRSAAKLTLVALQEDLYETGNLQRSLDFGHTFSPAIEARSGYMVSHGEAVAIDMCLSAAMAVKLGRLRPQDCERIIALIQAIGLPIYHPSIATSAMWQALEAAATHRAGRINLVIPSAIGSVEFLVQASDIPHGLVEGAAQDLCRRVGAGPGISAGRRPL